MNNEKMNNTYYEVIKERLVRERIVNTIIVSILLIVGFLGNATVILIYKFKIRTNRQDRFLVPILAFTDIFACLTGSILSILRNTNREAFPPDALCKVLFYSTSSISPISALLLMIISIVRYRKVCLMRQEEISIRCQSFTIFIMSVVVAILAVPMALFYGLREFGLQYRNDTIVVQSCVNLDLSENLRKIKIAYFAFVFLVIFMAFIVISVLYAKIGMVIFTKFRRANTLNHAVVPTVASNENSSVMTTMFSPMETDTLQRKRIQKRRKRTRNNFTYMYMVITLLYIVSYAPSMAFFIIPGNNPDEFWLNLSVVKLNMYLMLSRMYLLTHALNPVVYLYFDRTFRRELAACCQVLGSCRRILVH